MTTQNVVEYAWASGFIGFIISTGFYGITAAQTVFYLVTFRDDTKPLKFMVIFLLALDTLHLVWMVQAMWIILVKRRNNVASLGSVPWQIAASSMATFSITLLVQSFFALRVWRFSSKNRTLIFVIVAFAIAQFASGTALAVRQFIGGEESGIYESSISANAELLSSTLCDIVITSSLVYYLYNKRTGVEKTESVLQKLIVYTIHVGLLGCLVTFVGLILFNVQRYRFLSVGPHFIAGRCYANSLLATLNSRRSFREMFHFGHAQSFSLRTLSNFRSDQLPVLQYQSQHPEMSAGELSIEERRYIHESIPVDI